MQSNVPNAFGNALREARLKASEYNEQLKSREGAAEALGFQSNKMLNNWELGLSTPSSNKVAEMADLYHAPELENLYCTTMCPLGHNLPTCELEDIDRITVKALSVMRKVNAAKDMLLDITEDGVIDENEKPELDEILKTLNSLEEVTMSLKVWVQKNVK